MTLSKTTRPLALGLVTGALACAAVRPSQPASAAPRAVHRTRRTARHAVTPIDAHNAERVRLLWEAAAGGFAKGVAVSRKLDRVAFASGTPVRLYGFHSGKPVGTLPGCSDVIRGGLFFRGTRLIEVCKTGVQRFDVPHLRRLKPPAVASSPITAAALSGSRLLLGHHDGVIRVYDLDAGTRIEVPVPGPPIDVYSLAISPDGSRIAIAWVQGSIWWWELSAPDKPHRLVRHESESDSVAFNHDGSMLAEEGRDHFTSVWNLGGPDQSAVQAPPKVRYSLRNGAWIKRLLFTHDDAWLVRGGSDGLELAELGGPRRVVLDSTGRVEDAAFDEAESVIAAADRKGRLTLWGL